MYINGNFWVNYIYKIHASFPRHLKSTARIPLTRLFHRYRYRTYIVWIVVALVRRIQERPAWGQSAAIQQQFAQPYAHLAHKAHWAIGIIVSNSAMRTEGIYIRQQSQEMQAQKENKNWEIPIHERCCLAISIAFCMALSSSAGTTIPPPVLML